MPFIKLSRSVEKSSFVCLFDHGDEKNQIVKTCFIHFSINVDLSIGFGIMTSVALFFILF